MYRYDLILNISRQKRKQVYTMKGHIDEWCTKLTGLMSLIYVCRTYILSEHVIFFL